MATQSQSHNFHLDDSSRLVFGWKQFYAIVILLVALASGITAFQLKTSQSIHELYVQNQAAHEQIMLKLASMDSYALKAKVENAMVFVSKLRDMKGTNLVADEIAYRQSIRQFLQ
jgi:hypothetical protein